MFERLKEVLGSGDAPHVSVFDTPLFAAATTQVSASSIEYDGHGDAVSYHAAAAATAAGSDTFVTPPVTKGLKPKASSIPSMLTSTSTRSPIVINDRQLGTTDIARIARGQPTRTLIRELAHSSPDLSAAMFAYIRTGIPQGYTALAKNLDGTNNRDATKLVQQILTRMDLLNGYGLGFTGTESLRSIWESMAKDLWSYGATSGELVLDSARLPLKIQPVSVIDLKLVPRGDGTLVPQQTRAGQIILLDIPTFFYTALDRELTQAYPNAPMESAIKPTFFAEEFGGDLQRVTKRAVHPRITIAIDEAKFRQSIPPEVVAQGTPAIVAYRNQVEAAIRQTVNDIGPEEALVYFDTLGIDYLNNGNSSLSQEWESLDSFQKAKVSTGAKTPPSVLGHEVGSTNIASTEALLFMKNVEGAITFKLNDIMSQILTMAVRLFGQDVYVEFRFDDIDLRPKAELEGFKQTKQSRVLELLSLGLVTDEAASIALTGELPPEGMEPLSGTMFQTLPLGVEDAAAGDTSSNNGSALNQSLNPKTPKGSRGSNTKRNVAPAPPPPAKKK